MTMMTPDRFLGEMRRTPGILKAVLRGVSQARAEAATDGPDGWSVLFVMCHLADFEAIFMERARLILEQDNPPFPAIDQEALVISGDYASRALDAEFERYLKGRRDLVAYLSGLEGEQWHRQGIHAWFGQIDLLQLAMNVSLHDVTHIEQMVRALGLAEALIP